MVKATMLMTPMMLMIIQMICEVFLENLMVIG